MKNKIISIIFVLLILLLIIAMWKGINIGKINFLSIRDLRTKNEQLDEKIEMASSLTSMDYPSTIDTLETTYENYTIQKQKYEELYGFAEEDEKKVFETKQYDIGYLWKTIGDYATSYNLTTGIDIKKTTGENLYNLNFTVTGEYVNISEFITKIENNSDLYFRIDNFKIAGNSNTLTATFIVRDVSIDPSTITSTPTETETTDTNETDTNETDTTETEATEETADTQQAETEENS